MTGGRSRAQTLLALVAIALGTTALAPPAAAEEAATALVEPEPPVDVQPLPEPRKTIRLRGEVVETGCYVIGGRHGSEHEACAIACARAGQHLGILDDKTRQLYLSVVDHRVENAENPLMPFIAHRVDVRAELLEYGDLPAVIVSDVRSVGRVP